MKISVYLSKIGSFVLSLAFAAGTLTSCDSLYDYEGDCSATYRVKFLYDKNLKFADAFAHEVRSVTLYVLDRNGRVVWQRSESGEALASDNYAMTVEVDPGTYDLMAWCGLGDGRSFTVPAVSAGAERETLTCTLNRKHDSSGAYVNDRLENLYHGYVENQTFPDSEGEHVVTLPLTKNTNRVRVVLQHLSGEAVDRNKFDFAITDENGLMNWDNSLLQDEPVACRAWRIDTGTAEVDPLEGGAPATPVSVAVAEMSVARLVKGHRPTLTVTNKETGRKVLSIPVIDYALLVKGQYEDEKGREMTDQDYLDRQDEYSMTFFLDERGNWASAQVFINEWMIVLSDVNI